VEILQILILAVVQGITEFLPISSSGHLALVPYLTGWPDQGLLLDVATHVGSLFAVLFYFRKDLIAILLSLFSYGDKRDVQEARQLLVHLIIGSIPAVVAGGLLFYVAKTDLRSVLMVAAMTLFFGAVLGFADLFFKGNKPIRAMSHWDALFIGMFQIFALFPGTSRSGVTMTAALIRGLDREGAARFSMLLSIPVITGAGLVLSMDLIESQQFDLGLDALITGAVSFVVAYLAIGALMNWISKIGFMPFVWYRMALGGFLLFLYFGNTPA